MYSSIESYLEPGVNHKSGRKLAPVGVVIHVTEGDAAGVVSWFHTPNRDLPSSANDMVRKDGVRVKFVRWTDTAWAQGRVDNPTAKIVLDRPGVNPNDYLLSIEHEGDGLHDLTPDQFATSVQLIREMADEFEFPIDRYHVIGHHEIYKPKTCPGKIDVDKLVSAAASPHWSPITSTLGPDFTPQIVYSPYVRDYLIVTAMRSDTDWDFVSLKDAKAGGVGKSTTSLAKMPRHP